MKNLILINTACLVLSLFSCNRVEIEGQQPQVILKEGETKSQNIEGELIPVKLLGVDVLFNEGVVEEETTTIYRVYKATVLFGNDTLRFNTVFHRINDQPFKEKSWEEVFDRPGEITKTYKSYQIGISNIYTEQNPDLSQSYVVKLLIRK